MCSKRELLPVTDDVIRDHLRGTVSESKSRKDFTIGVHPLRPDETCWFLAADFDKGLWRDGITMVRRICEFLDVPTVVEHS